MNMEMEIEGTAEALEKGDRSRLDVGPLETASDRLVDVILTDGGANDGMDLGREVLGRRHPVPQRDRYGHDPLAGRHPGDDTPDQMRGRPGHAPGRPPPPKPAPPATERPQPHPAAP